MAKVAKKTVPAVELIVHECEQGSDAWYEAKLGRISASELSTILAQGERKGRLTLLRKLAGERITRQAAENYTNAYMERGKLMEAEARDWYARTRFADVEQVGFVYDPLLDAGWSPDGLVGDDGAVEIKTVAPHLLIPILEASIFPNEHRAQCQGGIFIGRRKWIDLVLYWPGMPKFVKRLKSSNDEQETIKGEIAAFNRDLGHLVEKLRRMNGEPIPRDAEREIPL